MEWQSKRARPPCRWGRLRKWLGIAAIAISHATRNICVVTMLSDMSPGLTVDVHTRSASTCGRGVHLTVSARTWNLHRSIIPPVTSPPRRAHLISCPVPLSPYRGVTGVKLNLGGSSKIVTPVTVTVSPAVDAEVKGHGGVGVRAQPEHTINSATATPPYDLQQGDQMVDVRAERAATEKSTTSTILPAAYIPSIALAVQVMEAAILVHDSFLDPGSSLLAFLVLLAALRHGDEAQAWAVKQAITLLSGRVCRFPRTAQGDRASSRHASRLPRGLVGGELEGTIEVLHLVVPICAGSSAFLWCVPILGAAQEDDAMGGGRARGNTATAHHWSKRPRGGRGYAASGKSKIAVQAAAAGLAMLTAASM